MLLFPVNRDKVNRFLEALPGSLSKSNPFAKASYESQRTSEDPKTINIRSLSDL